MVRMHRKKTLKLFGNIESKHYLRKVYLFLNTMQQGKVKFFNETKGFGFITPDDGTQDIFVHATGLIDKIRENDRVSYEVQDGKKGLNAVDVRIAH